MSSVTNHTSANSSEKAASLGRTKRPASDEVASCEPNHKKQKVDRAFAPSTPITPAQVSCPFTDAFFADMATVIRKIFPIGHFAETYHCDPEDVLDALEAVVLKPLHVSPLDELSVSDHAQVLIADWREAVAKTCGDIITISETDSSLEKTNPPSSSPAAADSPETAPQSDTHLSSIFTSPPQKPTSPSASSPSICNSSSEPAGKGTPDPETGSSKATKRSPSPTATIASDPSPPPKKRRYGTNPTSDRVEARRDWSGLLIPVENRIDGYHPPWVEEPAQPAQGDAMTDEEFERLLQPGGLKEILKEEEQDQVAYAKPGLKRRRPKR